MGDRILHKILDEEYARLAAVDLPARYGDVAGDIAVIGAGGLHARHWVKRAADGGWIYSLCRLW